MTTEVRLKIATDALVEIFNDDNTLESAISIAGKALKRMEGGDANVTNDPDPGLIRRPSVQEGGREGEGPQTADTSAHVQATDGEVIEKAVTRALITVFKSARFDIYHDLRGYHTLMLKGIPDGE